MNEEILLDKRVIEKLGILKFKTRKIINKISRGQVNDENIAKLSILSAFLKKPFYIYSGSKKLDRYIFECLSNIFYRSKPFELNIDRDTTIDDLLGPIDEDLISEGKYTRKIIGFLTSSDVCLLTNALEGNKYVKHVILEFMLQNTYMNDGLTIHLDIPLKIMTGQFNRPNDEVSKHIWNSVFLKYYINSASDARNAQKGIIEDNVNFQIDLLEEEKYFLDDIEFVRGLTQYINLDESSTTFINLLKKKINDFNELKSNSKHYGTDQIVNTKQVWKDIFYVMKISAILNGRSIVDITDCFVIEHILWNQPIHSNVISKFINDTSADFEYGFYYQYESIKEKYLKLSNFIKEKVLSNPNYETKVEKKIFINNIGKYYYFTSNEFNYNLFINVKDIDILKESIGILNVLNLSIKTYSKEDFINNRYSEKRLFLNFDGLKYFIYKNNNVADEKIIINPDLIEIQSDSIKGISMNKDEINDLSNWIRELTYNLHYDIKELNDLLIQDFSQLTKVNIFICDRKMDFYKKSIKDTLNKLNRIRESIQLISSNLKLISKGDFIGTIESFIPKLGF